MSRVFTIRNTNLRVHNDVLGFPELFELAQFIISSGWGQVSVNSSEDPGRYLINNLKLWHQAQLHTLTVTPLSTQPSIVVYGDIVGNQYSQPPVWYFILISYLYHASRITIIAIKYTMYSTIVVAHINSKPTVGRGFKLERFNWLGSLWIMCEVKITSEYLADKPYWDWHITSHSHQIWLQIILSWSLLDWFQFLQFWRSAANVGGKREEGGGRTRGEVNINNCSWWRGGVSLSLSTSP